MTKLRAMMRWGAAGLCLLGPAGCAPKIYRFDVLPYAVCAGTRSTVSWHIKGKPELTLTPPSQPISTKPLVYAPMVETKLVLRVRRGSHPDQTAPTSITVYPRGGIEQNEMAFTLACTGSTLSATASRPPTEWDPTIIVRGVSSDEDREITIEHEGRSATLSSASTTTDAFAGMSIAGAWTVKMPLLSSERCGDPTKAPPAVISLTHQVTCAR